MLESELERLERQISEYERTISEYQKQGKTLKGEIDKLNAKVAKIRLQIKAVSISLSNLNTEISLTTNRIARTEREMESHRGVIANSLQTIYQQENTSLLEVLLENPQLSDFFGNINNLVSLQGNVQISLRSLGALRDQYLDQKEQLGDELADAQALKAEQEYQYKKIQEFKAEQDDLLRATKGKEASYQELLVKTRKTAAQIRSRIFELLGGGAMSFEEAYKLAAFAEQATGVRAALLLAVLDRESALGQNVGQCTYAKAMHPTRDIPIFLALVDELGMKQGLENGTLKVSCPNADGAYGGALGPAQFLPSTWKAYTSRISKITGNAPASPWHNMDAFVGAALYLKDGGAAENERRAAAKYYCGTRWNRYVCLNVYGKRVVEQAERFEQDIKILKAGAG